MDDSERSYGFSRDLYHGSKGVGGHYQETGNTHFDRSYEYGAEGEPGDNEVSPEEAAMHVIDGTTLRTGGEEAAGSTYDHDRTSNYGQVESFTWDLNDGPPGGQGPQDSQRTDSGISEEICNLLTDHGAIDATHIEVKVENGEVTLSGKAPDRRTKRLAEAVAETVRGVTDVHNRLRLG
jgi:hypothetical protein